MLMRFDSRAAYEAPLDVWSFRAAERLKVHEARTEADTMSGVHRHAPLVKELRPVYREKEKE